MFKQRSRRGGFTLPEVLVTVAIVAVLAAMVVPAVTQQISKADAPSFETSMGSLRTAITSFVSDTRKYPGDLEDLQSAITGADADIDAVAYTTAVQGRWRGPYDNSGISTGVIPVGMEWNTVNALKDTLSYIRVSLTQAGADTTHARALDVAIDGGNGGATGTIRYDPTTSGTVALTPANTVWVFLMSSAR